MSVSCVGEIFVELKGTKHLLECSSFEVAIGGLAAKIAIELSKLGINVKFFCALGNDVFNEFLTDKLSSIGVDVRKAEKNLRTTLLITLNNDVKMFFRKPYFRSADTELTLNNINLDEILESDALLCTSLSLTENPLKHTVHYVAKNMFKNGKKTFFYISTTYPYKLNDNEILSILKHTSHVLIDHEAFPLFYTTKPKTLAHIIFRKTESVRKVAVVYNSKTVSYDRSGYEIVLNTNYNNKIKNVATYIFEEIRKESAK